MFRVGVAGCLSDCLATATGVSLEDLRLGKMSIFVSCLREVTRFLFSHVACGESNLNDSNLCMCATIESPRLEHSLVCLLMPLSLSFSLCNASFVLVCGHFPVCPFCLSVLHVVACLRKMLIEQPQLATGARRPIYQ